MSRIYTSILSGLTLWAGCALNAHFDGLDDSSLTGTTTASTGELPDGSGGADVMTTTETGGGLDEAPVITHFAATPDTVPAVGPVQVSLQATGQIERVDLYAGDGDTLLAGDLPLQSPLYTIAVTSDDIPGDRLHTLRAVVHDRRGRTAEATTTLLVDVEPGGAPQWSQTLPLAPSAYTGAAPLGLGIAAVGWVEQDGERRLMAVKLDGATGLPEAAPVIFDDVVMMPGEAIRPSIATNAAGEVYLASTVQMGDSTTWLVLKTRLDNEPSFDAWRRNGEIGDQASALLLAGGKVFLSGATRVADAPPSHHLKLWSMRQSGGGESQEHSLLVPPLAPREEHAHALIEIAGGFLSAGTRVVPSANDPAVQVTRSVLQRYSLDGTPQGELWTSPGELFEEDAIYALARLKSGGAVAIGWGRNKASSSRSVVLRWLSPEGEPVASDVPLQNATGYVIAEDREQKLIFGASLKSALSAEDIWIEALAGANASPAEGWTFMHNSASDGPDEIAGIALDTWGHVHGVGQDFADLQPRAFAVRLRP